MARLVPARSILLEKSSPALEAVAGALEEPGNRLRLPPRPLREQREEVPRDTPVVLVGDVVLGVDLVDGGLDDREHWPPAQLVERGLRGEAPRVPGIVLAVEDLPGPDVLGAQQLLVARHLRVHLVVVWLTYFPWILAFT